MPRVKFLVPPEQLALEEELRNRHGGMMDTRSVGKELGLKDTAAAKWLEDVTYVLVNNRRRYPVRHVAEKIYLSTNI